MPTIAYDAEWRTKVAGGNKPPPTLNTEEALFCISVSSLGLVVGQLSCLWLVLAQIFGRADLVHAHESAVASHIGRKDRCKPAFDALLCHGRLSPLGYRLRNCSTKGAWLCHGPRAGFAAAIGMSVSRFQQALGGLISCGKFRYCRCRPTPDYRKGPSYAPDVDDDARILTRGRRTRKGIAVCRSDEGSLSPSTTTHLAWRVARELSPRARLRGS